MSGPGFPFELLVETDTTVGVGLPEEITAVWGGNWVLPDTSERIYHFSNFVMSHDGKVSFAVPGHEGGGDVSGFNPHDKWVMALLRSRADAVLVGANTLRTESEHLWTSDFIFPTDRELFARLRVAEGRAPQPLQVFVTRTGDIPTDAAVFREPDLRVVVVTSAEGAQVLHRSHGASVERVVAGESEVDLAEVHRILHRHFGVRTILSEGGPRVYGALVQAGQVDEEFLTVSPVIVGGSQSVYRPGLLDGWALEPGHHHRAQLVSLRRAGDYLFLRTRWTRGGGN